MKFCNPNAIIMITALLSSTSYGFDGRCISYKIPQMCHTELVNLQNQIINIGNHNIKGHISIEDDMMLRGEWFEKENGKKLGGIILKGIGKGCDKFPDGREICIANFECPKNEKEYFEYLSNSKPCLID